MKYLGGFLMFVAISVVTEIAHWEPDPDRSIIELLIWFVSAGLFLGGLELFGSGIKREVADKVQ